MSYKWTRLLAAAWLAFAGAGSMASGQSPVITVTLTGQSMIRSDIRAHAPGEVPIIKSLLKGDVAFTNFECTIVDEKKGQSHMNGRFVSPPEAMDALQSFGFNLVSLSNNHSWDLKLPGLREHAGGGKTAEPGARWNREQHRGSCRAGLSAHVQGHGGIGRTSIRPG